MSTGDTLLEAPNPPPLNNHPETATYRALEWNSKGTALDPRQGGLAWEFPVDLGILVSAESSKQQSGNGGRSAPESSADPVPFG